MTLRIGFGSGVVGVSGGTAAPIPGARFKLREVAGVPVMIGAGPGGFDLDLPAGAYVLSCVVGDPKGVARLTEVSLDGTPAAPPIPTAGRAMALLRMGIAHRGGPLRLGFSAPGGTWSLRSVEVVPGDGPHAPEVSPVGRMEDRWVAPAGDAAEPARRLAGWLAARPGEPPAPRAAPDYLAPIAGVVGAFLPHQDGDGAILDPVERREIQYATPCFAHAAALLARDAGRADLVAPAMAAFRHAARALATRQAPDGHEDFFAAPLAHAYRCLHALPGLAGALEAAAAPLRGFDPYRTYRKPPGGHKVSGANWNCKALAGHQMLVALGLNPHAGFVADSLLAQGYLFDNGLGLYAEGPATYDIFPRAWLGVMLDWGYDGPAADRLRDALRRGAATSLFLQSPAGEWMIGGRSSQHQWADALQCTVFEWAGNEALAAGREAEAAVFRRAARLALGALEGWRRPTGEFWIVKNRMEPPARHGFEPYSHHSQYNLLAATALGFAHELARGAPRREAAAAPAEAGTGLVEVRSSVQKLVAGAAGTQAIVSLRPTAQQTPQGLLRLHMLGLPTQLPLSDGRPRRPMFALPGEDTPGVVAGPCWRVADGWASLADAAPGEWEAEVTPLAAAPDAQCYAITWRHAAGLHGPMHERHELGAGRAWLEWHLPFRTGPARLRWPAFAHDGRDAATLSLAGRRAVIRHGGAAVALTLDAAAGDWEAGAHDIAFRAGYLRVISAEIAGHARLLVERME